MRLADPVWGGAGIIGRAATLTIQRASRCWATVSNKATHPGSAWPVSSRSGDEFRGRRWSRPADLQQPGRTEAPPTRRLRPPLSLILCTQSRCNASWRLQRQELEEECQLSTWPAYDPSTGPVQSPQPDQSWCLAELAHARQPQPLIDGRPQISGITDQLVAPLQDRVTSCCQTQLVRHSSSDMAPGRGRFLPASQPDTAEQAGLCSLR